MRSCLLAFLCTGCVIESAVPIEADELRKQADRATEATSFEGGALIPKGALPEDGPAIASFYSPLRLQVGEPFEVRITPLERPDEVAGVLFTIDHATQSHHVPARVEAGEVVISGVISDDADFDRALRLAGVALVDEAGRRGETTPMPIAVRGDVPVKDVRFRTLSSVAPRVLALAFPPTGDDDFVVAGGGSGVLARWQLGRVGRPVQFYRGHEGDVRVARVSFDRRFVASGGADGTVRVFQAESGDQLAVFSEHEGVVRALEWSQDGRLLVSGGWDGFVRVRSVPDGTLVQEVDTGQRVNAVAISRGGRHFIVAGGRPLHPGEVTLVDLMTGERKTWSDLPREATAAAFSPDGDQFAVGFGRGAVRVWTTGSDAEPVELESAGSDAVEGVVFPAGRVVAATLNGLVTAWDAEDGAVLSSTATDEILMSVALSGDLATLALGNVDGVVRMFDFSPILDAVDAARRR